VVVEEEEEYFRVHCERGGVEGKRREEEKERAERSRSRRRRRWEEEGAGE
jgi:hypothetical protein